MGKEVAEELLGMFWEIYPTFGGGLFFLGDGTKGDARFDDFDKF